VANELQADRTALVAALEQPRFELIPIAGALEQAAHLPRGATATITCSPARGIEHTLDYAERLPRQDLRVVPHISARLVRDTSHLCEITDRLASLGLREIFVVGGDAQQPVGQFASAIDLLRALEAQGHGLDAVGVAAYPEPHPLIDEATLRRALREKQRFAAYMVTQICFDARTIASWLASARRDGITLPVYIGLPGAADAAHLLRIAMKIGVGTSVRFLSRHAGLAARMLKPGLYRPTNVVEALAPYLGDADYNIAGFHLNTFNQVQSTDQWRRQLLATARSVPGLSFSPRGGS
jgi:methylenetetrahydrofolate reductase (NADPH)